ncbi:MAG: DUF4111 domain-containing protein [Anaerolineae bacterium]|nr:DUF4111 domain-containing protein [Anaerolineae bacterium]
MKLRDDVSIPNDPYPELRDVLDTFVTEISTVLAEHLIGIYLVGSLASGDFDADSDVDFLVVTDTELTGTQISSLQDIQRKIYRMDCYPAKHLEGSYISLSDLNNWETVGEKELYYFDNGSTTFEQSIHDNNWHVRWILRERGITLVGQPSETLVPAIPRDALLNEIRTAMRWDMHLFEEAISHPLNFWNSRFGQSFAVLTYCRMLHTLHTGTVQSKKAGVQWARQCVDPKWVNIIDQAWEEREGVRFGIKIGQQADPALLHETLEFIKYAVTHMDHFEV